MVYGNLAWDLRAYEQTSLVQDNLLLRVAFDGNRFDPYLDLLLAPGDDGWMVTAGFDLLLRQGVNLRGGARGFGGPTESVYGQMPTRSTLFLELHCEVVM